MYPAEPKRHRSGDPVASLMPARQGLALRVPSRGLGGVGHPRDARMVGVKECRAALVCQGIVPHDRRPPTCRTSSSAPVSVAQRLLREPGVRWGHGELACPRVVGPWACRRHTARGPARARGRSHTGKISPAVLTETVSPVLAAAAWDVNVDVGPASRGEPAALLALGVPAAEVEPYVMALDGGGILVSVAAAAPQVAALVALLGRSAAAALAAPGVP